MNSWLALAQESAKEHDDSSGGSRIVYKKRRFRARIEYTFVRSDLLGKVEVVHVNGKPTMKMIYWS